MALYSVSVSWIPSDSTDYFHGTIRFSTLVLASDREDARKQVIEHCIDQFNASNFVSTCVQ